MAASEQSSSQNLVLTDRPLSGIPYGRFGSGRACPPFKSTFGKRSLKFRFPEAAIRH